MTDKEKAIVMAHTGICMLTGDKFQIFHKYVEDIMGRPIMTHEIGWLADAIKEKSKADFLALCEDESGSENPNEWEPTKEEKALLQKWRDNRGISMKDFEDAMDALEQEQKTGHWIYSRAVNTKEIVFSECSVCGNGESGCALRMNYCPNCGAKMEAEE